MECSTFASTPSAISHEDSIVRMVLERSLNIGSIHASETAEAYKLTQEYAAQFESITHSPLLNGDCLPAIAEKVDEHLSCKDLMLVERIQIKRLRIVDRVRQNKLRELEVKFMKQVSIVDEDPNAETRALSRAELDRARFIYFRTSFFWFQGILVFPGHLRFSRTSSMVISFYRSLSTI